MKATLEEFLNLPEVADTTASTTLMLCTTNEILSKFYTKYISATIEGTMNNNAQIFHGK